MNHIRVKMLLWNNNQEKNIDLGLSRAGGDGNSSEEKKSASLDNIVLIKR